jgi:peptide/nickel transport system substrate-binding protein
MVPFKKWGVILSVIIGLVLAGGLVLAQQPKYGGTLVVAAVTDIVGIDPHKVSAEVSMIVLNHIYERLVDLDEKNMPMPGLASRWSVSSDGLVYTFHLRQGVKFHNGREMTADDVVYTYNRLMDPKTKYPFVTQVQNIKDIKATDKYTVQFTVKAPTVTLLVYMSNPLGTHAIVPKEEVEKQGGTLTRPVGTGPYKFVEYVPDKHVIIERNKDYKGSNLPTSGTGGMKPAYADRIKFVPIKDAAVRSMALKSGDIDFTFRVAWEEIDDFKKDPNVVTYVSPGLAYVTLLFGVNTSTNKFIRTPDFRRAVGFCLDLQELVDGSVFGNSVINPSLVNVVLPFYSDIHKKGYRKDLKMAKELLKKVGYDGTPVKIGVTKVYLNTYKTAILAEQMLGEAGIKVALDVKEWPALLQDANSGKYDMLSYIFSGMTDPSLTMRHLHSKRNFVGYKNENLDALVEKAEATSDFVTRKKLYEQIHEVMLEDVPLLKLYDHSVAPATRKYVKGFKPMPYTADARLWQVWLDK